jgi:hypothetical protein
MRAHSESLRHGVAIMSERRVLVNTTLPAPIIAIFFGISGSFMDLAVGRPGDRLARAAAN